MPKQSQDPQWMVVLVTNNPMEAHVVAGRLDSEGVPAWVHQEPYGSAMGLTVGKLGEVRVLVKYEDYDRAVDILDSGDYDELPEDVDQTVFGDELDEDYDEGEDADEDE
jgi:hypothetical protein